MQRFSVFVVCLVAAMFAAAAGAAADAAGATSADDFTLKLAEFEFDPLTREPELPDGWDKSRPGGPDLHLVQFDGPIKGGTLEKLRTGGVEPIQYIYPHTYIVWGRTADREGVRREKSVRWTGDFAPAFRVQPHLRNLSSSVVDVRVLLYRGADVEGALKAITLLGGTLTSRLAVHDKLEVAKFTLPGDRMQAAASIPGVYSIQVQPVDGGSRGEVTAQINAGNVDASNVALPGYQSWLAGLGLDGSGVIVAGVDEGVYDIHPDLAGAMLPCTGPTCSVGSSFHGTHTAGIIVGDATSGTLDANGFLRGQGVAPGANLIEQRYFPAFTEPGGMLKLMADSSRNGATLSSNSWGPSSGALGYDVDTLLADLGVRDADPAQPGNQPLIYVQAFDNGDGGVSTQGTPDDAKNIFTIGSTRGMAFDGTPDTEINSLSFNSAHGPALDGRTIPHLVAPGCHVDSTFPDDGEGLMHGAMCGTSQATPQVAGSVALFIERWRNQPGYVADPSPALVKAAFMPVAHDLEGNLDADDSVLGHRPDSKQGWGRLNLPAVIDPPADSVEYFDEPRIFEVTNEQWVRIAAPVNLSEPMRIMLVWTDAPGHGLGGSTPAWNNDLDLVVEVDSNTYLGNVFGIDGFSETGGMADPMNNAEGVFLQGLSGNEVTIRVVATDINSDGVPNHGDETDQDFALVCYNCDLVPGFALATSPATINTCAPDDASYVIDVEQFSGYSDPVTLSVVGAPVGTTPSFDTNPVAPGASSWLTIDPGSVADGDYTMEVHGDTIDLNRTIPIYLRLRTSSPGAANLTLPANGAVDVYPQPTLEWAALPWADQYVVEVSDDAGFQNIVYSARTRDTSHVMGLLLAQQAHYYWRVRATNACGFGLFSTASSFTTQEVTDLLLVDGDGDYFGDFQSDYTDALIALGVSYDLWDIWGVHNGTQPDPMTVAPYERMIWYTGREEFESGPLPASETMLADWLDQAGCLFVSSPDYLLARGYTDFIQERLGVASFVEDAGQEEVTGAGSIFGGLGPYGLSNVPGGNDYSDNLSPDTSAEQAFDGGLFGPAGVNKDGGVYRTSFLGFQLERSGATGMQQTLSTFFSWCDGLPGVDGDSDGLINSADCAPADVNAWTAPSPITDLTVNKGTTQEFTWSEPVSGGGAEYAVLRSLDPTDWWNASCLQSGITGTMAFPDVDPQPGELFFYLVRVRSACGVADLGIGSDGTVREGAACNSSLGSELR
jgi:hypothetical protein